MLSPRASEGGASEGGISERGGPPRAVSGRPRTSAHTLAEKNAGLVWFAMARFFRRELSDEDRAADLYTAGLLALVRAAEGFDPTRGVTFSTYAVKCVRHGILNELAGGRQRAGDVSLETPIGGDGETELGDVLADPRAERPGAALVAQAGFERLLTDLGPRHQRLIRALYRDEMTPAEVAAEWGCSIQTVYDVTKSAVRALRRQPALRQEAWG